MAQPESEPACVGAGERGRGVLNVVVVDDHRTFADAISLAMDTLPDVRCAATVSSAEQAISVVRERCPDAVLLDVALPGMSGIEAIAELKAACPDLRVIVLTANTTAETLLAAAEAGADRFLPKEQPFADVLQAIRDVDETPVADPRSMAGLLRQARLDGPSPARDGVALTDREFEILALLADGITVKQIAQRLGISLNTCRGHVRALLAKFDTHTQLAAVVRAARAGMLPNLRAFGD